MNTLQASTSAFNWADLNSARYHRASESPATEQNVEHCCKRRAIGAGCEFCGPGRAPVAMGTPWAHRR